MASRRARALSWDDGSGYHRHVADRPLDVAQGIEGPIIVEGVHQVAASQVELGQIVDGIREERKLIGPFIGKGQLDQRLLDPVAKHADAGSPALIFRPHMALTRQQADRREVLT